MAIDECPATATALKRQIERLHTEIAKLEVLTANRQATFRAAFDRDGAEQLMADLLRMTADQHGTRLLDLRTSWPTYGGNAFYDRGGGGCWGAEPRPGCAASQVQPAYPSRAQARPTECPQLAGVDLRGQKARSWFDPKRL